MMCVKEHNMNMAKKKLEEVIRGLSEEDRHKIEDYAHYLSERHKSETSGTKGFDIDRVIGMALKEPLNPNPQFKNEDDLWE